MVQFHVLQRIPRRLLSVLATAAMMLAIVPAVTFLTAAPARAAVVGGFEIDGNATVQSDTDWDAVSTAPNVQDNNPENTVLAGDNDTKEASPPSGWDSSGSPPKKVDFVNVWSYAHNDGTTPYLDIAYSRLGETGTGGFYVELKKKPNNTNGNRGENPPPHEGGQPLPNAPPPDRGPPPGG